MSAVFEDIDLPTASVEQMVSREAEATVLGGLMLDNGLFEAVGDMLVPKDFYSEVNGRIFAVLQQNIMACKPVDVITVFEELRAQRDQIQQVSLPELHALAQFAPSFGTMRRHAQVVRERALSRKLARVSDEIHGLALDQQRPIDVRIEEATGKLVQLVGDAPDEDWQGADAGVVEFLDGIDRRANGEEDFLPTGLKELDERLDGGMRRGEVIVIAGRPGMGKTALAVSIADNVCNAGEAVGVLSMEMPKAQLTTRVVSLRSGIPLHKLKRPERMSDFDWSEMTRTVDQLRTLPLFISDQTALNINQVRTKARALKRRRKVRLLVIDYIGLMEGTDRKANRSAQLGEVSRGIKALAKELNCTVLLLAQLNRDVEKRPKMRPILADLRECGDIEQDADIILFVHRPAHVTPDLGIEWKHYAEIIVGKQRDGQTGVVDAQYTGDTVKFCNWQGERPTAPTRTKGAEL